LNQREKELKVTERDIFNFVFYPDLVREEIKMFLASIENSTDTIIFYKELKSSLEIPLDDNIKQKLSKKIRAYKYKNVIQLYPVQELKKKRNGIVLAAASVEEKPKIITKTFYDADKTYIIKVINYSDNSKIFVFSTQQEVIKDFEIIILPENKKYHCKDNLLPLELNTPIEAESIQIEFNLKSV
jgi:hypothetical protein